MKKVFVLGSLNMDLIFRVDRIPKGGETISGQDFQTSPGGKGSNQAVACAKQGVETIMLGSLGEDAFADRIKESLNQYNVNTAYLKVIDNASTGLACIWVQAGENRIVLNAGANFHHDMKDIESTLKTQSNPGDMILLQMEIPVDIIEKTIELAKSLSLKIVLNLAPYKALNQTSLEAVDLLILNKLEAEVFLSKDLDMTNQNSLKDLLKFGPKSVILTQGSQGSDYYDGQVHIHTPAFPVDLVDATGAGDAFIGCFIGQQVMGESLETSLKRASVAGALTIRKVGVHPAIPTDQMILDFLRDRGDE